MPPQFALRRINAWLTIAAMVLLAVASSATAGEKNKPAAAGVKQHESAANDADDASWPKNVEIHRPEIDAITCYAASVRYRRMKLCSREQHRTPHVDHQAQLRIRFKRDLGTRLDTRVCLDVTCGILPTGAVPLVIVVDVGVVRNGAVPELRMKSHAVFRCDLINGQPPIDLREGGRIPSVAVRMKCVGNPRGQVCRWIGRTQTGHIEIYLVGAAANGCNNFGQETLTFRMMYKSRLQ